MRQIKEKTIKGITLKYFTDTGVVCWCEQWENIHKLGFKVKVYKGCWGHMDYIVDV